MALAASTAFSQSCGSKTDHRFGTVGVTPDFPWWRNYNADHLSASASYTTKMYTVGKLDDPLRTMGTEDWCKAERSPQACFNDRPFPPEQARIYNNIFEYDKANIQSIILKYAPSAYNYNGATTLHFAIGNEPNWFPYVEPAVYADIYKKYYDYIKGPTGLNCQNCAVHTGGLFLGNIITNNIFFDALYASVRAFKYLVQGESSNQVMHYMAWHQVFLRRLEQLGAKVDIFNVHAYNLSTGDAPIDPVKNLNDFLYLTQGGEVKLKYIATQGLPSGSYTCYDGNKLHDSNGRFVMKLDDYSPCRWGAKVLDIGTEYFASRFPWSYPNPVIWVDEFGQLDPNGSSDDAKSVMNNVVSFLKGNAAFQKWFWYKATGNDTHIPTVKVNLIGVGNSLTLLTPPNVELYGDPNNQATRTSLGSNYMCLQDDHPPAPTSRMSWSPPPVPIQYLNISPWPQATQNILLNYPFGNINVDRMNGWATSNGISSYEDGVKLNTSCNTVGFTRNFSAAEQAVAGKEGRYFVVESGDAFPRVGDRYVLTIRNQAGSTRTVTIETDGSFGNTPNPMSQQGMGGVIDLLPYLGPDESLQSLSFTRNVTLNLCAVNSFPFRGAYFARYNPVPIGAADNFYGISIPATPYNGGKAYSIPVRYGACSGCVIDIDQGSKDLGIRFDAGDRTLNWIPRLPRDGTKTLTFTISKGGQTSSKSFDLNYTKLVTIVPQIGLLLGN